MASQAEGCGSSCACFAFLPTQASARFIGLSMVSAPYALIQRGNGPSRGFVLALRLEGGKDALRAFG